jgi:hypothetical protein
MPVELRFGSIGEIDRSNLPGTNLRGLTREKRRVSQHFPKNLDIPPRFQVKRAPQSRTPKKTTSKGLIK